MGLRGGTDSGVGRGTGTEGMSFTSGGTAGIKRETVDLPMFSGEKGGKG